MPPSRKIFVGSSLVLSAVLLQVILGIFANRLMGDISSSVQTAGTMDNVDSALDGLHSQSIVLFAGVGVVWLLIASGVILFMIGAYQNCKTTESLLARSRQEEK